jgi:hypothetical protein
MRIYDAFVSRMHVPLTKACMLAHNRAHSRSEKYLEVFEYLLQQGADASILTYEGWNVRGLKAPLESCHCVSYAQLPGSVPRPDGHAAERLRRVH